MRVWVESRRDDDDFGGGGDDHKRWQRCERRMIGKFLKERRKELEVLVEVIKMEGEKTKTKIKVIKYPMELGQLRGGP